MPSNEGYINIVAVMQKFFDQLISGNWSYNPENYPDNEVPVSVMAQDLLTTYKLGWKTSYYQNTHDMKTDEIDTKREDLEKLISADRRNSLRRKIVTVAKSRPEGMTVFNKNKVDAKKQPMFFGAPLESRDMTLISIQYLKDLLNRCWVISGDLRKFPFRKIGQIIMT